MVQFRRRKFLVAASTLCAARFVSAQSRTYRVGFIGLSEALAGGANQAFFTGLRELGYREGQDLVVERRYTEGRPDRLPALAMELINLGVEVIVVGGELAALTVKAARPALPVVMAWSFDPVGSGLAASLARPGGSVTGLTWDVGKEQVSKRLQLFKETVPSMSRIAVIWDPTNLGTTAYWPFVNTASKALGIETSSVEVRTAGDLTAALEGVRKNRPSALFVWGGPATSGHFKQITEFAIQERLPAFAASAPDVDRGYLMAYSVNGADLYRRAARFVDRILKGAKPGELPIEQPTKFELVINLKTARAIGLTIPPSILLRADRVIE
jgi:putative ABC transport system substrate-binding protein